MPKLMRPKGGAGFDVADIAGMMGPFGLPAVGAGLVGKITSRIPPEMIEGLTERLNKPIQAGRRLLQSINPASEASVMQEAAGAKRMVAPSRTFNLNPGEEDALKKLEELASLTGSDTRQINPFGHGTFKEPPIPQRRRLP